MFIITCNNCQDQITWDIENKKFIGEISNNWKKNGKVLAIKSLVADIVEEESGIKNYCLECWRKTVEKKYRQFCSDWEEASSRVFQVDLARSIGRPNKWLFYDKDNKKWGAVVNQKDTRRINSVIEWEETNNDNSNNQSDKQKLAELKKQLKDKEHQLTQMVSQPTLILSIIGTFILSLTLGLFLGKWLARKKFKTIRTKNK